MDLTQSLFEWLKTFDLVVNCGSLEELCDGVAISHVLNQICPEYFKTEWLKKIEADCGTNWRLRVSNLRKVYEAVVDYYTDVLDKQLDDKLLPDVQLIGRDNNTGQLALLLQLILGCAINCQQKEHFIAIMTNLDLDIQHGIKTAIQQMETFDDSNSLAVDPIVATNHTVNVINNNESSVQRCAELEVIVNKLNDEKLVLQMENEKLSEKVKIMQNYESNSNHSIDNEVMFKRLNEEIIRLKNDLLKTDELKEDFRLNAELSEKEANRLRQLLDESMTKLNDFKQDRDELDRLQYLNEEIERYKSKESVHVRNREELKETKRQQQEIRDRNQTLTKKICELEEEIKRLSIFKGQIDIFKRQKEDLRLKVGEEGFRADRAEEEINRWTKKFEELQQEKDKYYRELNDLRRELSQQKGFNQNQLSLDTEFAPIMHSTQQSVEMMQKNDFNLTQLQEKLTRLEFENSKLSESRQKSDDECVTLLESQLEEEKARVNDLESEQRLLNHKIIKLEAELRDPIRLSDDEQMQTFQDIIKQKELSLDSAKHDLVDAQQEIESLKADIVKKDEELTEKEVQYQKYVNKAKVVTTALDQLSQQSIVSNTSISSTSSDANNDINYWKQLAQQKDLELAKHKHDSEESNSFREMEAKLLTISFHNLSSHVQRKSAEERIRNGPLNSGQNSVSFLARQRQATTRKYNMPTVSQRLCNEHKYNSFL